VLLSPLLLAAVPYTVPCTADDPKESTQGDEFSFQLKELDVQ
jgi:hypothetical protein